MSQLYVPALITHVVVAILGVGSIASVALLAATARRSGRGAAAVVTSIRPLLLFVAFSLAAMLVTGVLLNVAVGGGYGRAWWFRGSVLLLIATGVLNGLARRALRAQPADEREASAALRRVEGMAYVMSALVAAIATLMELKPF